jgi:PAS domain S-box-containing protein
MPTGQLDLHDLFRLGGVPETVLDNLPVWLWDIEAGRIVFANAAGVTFFRDKRLSDLLKRGFDMRRPGMARLERAATTLPRDGSPRLTMLRFFVGMRDVAMACSCRLIEGGNTGLVLVAATAGGPDRRPLEARAAILFDDLATPVVLSRDGTVIYSNEAADTAPKSEDAPVFEIAERNAAVTITLGGRAGDSPETAETDTAPGQAECKTVGEDDREDNLQPRPAAGPPPARGHRRFSFVLDEEGRFVEIGPALAAAVGPDSADVVGHHWSDIAQMHGLDPDGRVAAMLDSRESWSGVVLQWPTDDGATATVQLAAQPRLGNGRVFAGFRGFGDVVAVGSADDAMTRDDSPPADELDDDAVFVDTDAPAPEEEDAGSRNVLQLRSLQNLQGTDDTGLSVRERHAFQAIADALGARLPEDMALAGKTQPADSSGQMTGAQPVAPDGETATEDTGPGYTSGDTSGEAETTQPLSSTPAAGHGDAEESQQRSGNGASDIEQPPDAARPEVESDTTGSQDDGQRPPIADETATGARDTTSPPPAPAATATHDPGHAETVVSAILERIHLGIAIVRDERVIYANRAFLEIFDYSDLDDLEVAGGLSVLFEGRSSEPLGAAVMARRRDGEAVMVESRLGRIAWVDGPAMFVTAREIHAAAQTEPHDDAAVQVAELRTVLDTATDGVLVLGADGTVETVNRSAQALFGREADEIRGRPFDELVAEESRVAVRDYLDGLASGGVMSVLNDGREILGRANGGEVPLFLTMGRIGDGTPARFCAVIRDQTDWKAAEAELTAARKRAEEANEQKSDFLAKMSHEIRTPLNAIIGFAEVILEERFGAIGNDRYRDYVKDIRASGEHIMSLVNDLLDLSKVEAGKLELNFTGVNLNDIVEQSVAIMQPQANRERVIIRSSLARNLPPVVADTRSLRQVMLNLMSNAIKFTPPGGQVILSTVITDEGEVLLRVRDTGIGMSEAGIQTALEPFRQLAVRSETHQRGTGLGLPLTRALVEANRAGFAIRSRPNEGTLVEVSFPQSRVLAE